MTISIQSYTISALIVFIIILVIVYISNKALKKYNENCFEKPSLLVTCIFWVVEFFDNLIEDTVAPSYVKKMSPFMCAIGTYILISNYIGLLGFNNPTANISFNLALSLFSWFIIQTADIKYSGITAYIKSLFEPFFLFFFANFISLLAPIISMAFRLFGNLTSGSIIMNLLYAATGALSKLLFGFIPIIGEVDLIGPIIAAPLRLYFDLFSGAIQAYIFIMLTVVLTGVKIPEELKIKKINN